MHVIVIAPGRFLQSNVLLSSQRSGRLFYLHTKVSMCLLVLQNNVRAHFKILGVAKYLKRLVWTTRVVRLGR